MRIPRLPLLLALALLGSAAGPLALPRACADDLKDARKAFRGALSAADWKQRRDAYMEVADWDDPSMVEDVLDALVRETNPAVVRTGIGVLAGYASDASQARLVAEVRKGHGRRRMLVLLALARQRGGASVPILLEILQGKDGPAAAQAALALGARHELSAVPHLVALLGRKDWQLRRAAGLALAELARPPAPAPEAGAQPPAQAAHGPVPEALRAPEVTSALVAALGRAEGVDRQALIAALEAIHGRTLGYNLAAWKLVAAGKEVDEKTLAKRVYPPAAFGIPLYGQRIVLVYDDSLRSGDPHRFGSGDRLLELCKVPGSDRPIFSARILTVGQFARAHFLRCVADMPSKTHFEVITFNAIVRPLFGRFVAAGGARRKAVQELFDSIRPDDGIATYDALNTALDTGGATDAKAWKHGPDEIVFTTCNEPTVGDIKEADVIAAAISLKARMRMVRIHTVGIESHPYSMMRTIARETGGIYRNDYK